MKYDVIEDGFVRDAEIQTLAPWLIAILVQRAERSGKPCCAKDTPGMVGLKPQYSVSRNCWPLHL